MSRLYSSGSIRPTSSSSIKSALPVTTLRPPAILNIPLDFIEGLEDSDALPFLTVLGNGVEKCYLEKGLLKIVAPGFRKAVISYGVLNLGQTKISGSVMTEMSKEEVDIFSHQLKPDAVMVGVIYLS